MDPGWYSKENGDVFIGDHKSPSETIKYAINESNPKWQYLCLFSKTNELETNYNCNGAHDLTHDWKKANFRDGHFTNNLGYFATAF